MAIARVVSFEDVSPDGIKKLKRDISEGPPPEGLPASEILVLHDADTRQALVVLLFENEQAYAQSDATLNAMPAAETPGRRASVQRFTVAIRRTALCAEGIRVDSVDRVSFGVHRRGAEVLARILSAPTASSACDQDPRPRRVAARLVRRDSLPRTHPAAYCVNARA